MTNYQQIKDILIKIAQTGIVEDGDIEIINETINSHEKMTIQIGKKIINIAKGEGIQIGDRIYYEWNEEAIQALVETIQSNHTINQNNTSKGDNIGRDKNETNTYHNCIFVQLLTQDNNIQNSLPQNFTNDIDFPVIPEDSIQQAYRDALPVDANLFENIETNEISQILLILENFRKLPLFFKLLSQNENISSNIRDQCQNLASQLAEKKHPEDKQNKPKSNVCFGDEYAKFADELEISLVIDKIKEDKHTEADIQELRQALIDNVNAQVFLQLGKYNFNIGQGKDIHIGDRIYQQWDEEAVQYFVELIRNYEKNKEKVYENIGGKGISTEQFKGREEKLNELHSSLQNQETNSLTAVTGMIGVGKTELAIQYAYQYFNFYGGGVAFFNAKNFAKELVDFARSQFSNFTTEENIPLKQQVQACYTKWGKQNEKVLLIIDKINDNYEEEIEPYLPRNNRFKILLTSRKNIKSFKVNGIELDIFTENEALSLLEHFIGKDNVNKQLKYAVEVCKKSGRTPLALHLIGKYITEKSSSLKQVLNKIEKIHDDSEQSLKKKYSANTPEGGLKNALQLAYFENDNGDKYWGTLSWLVPNSIENIRPFMDDFFYKIMLEKEFDVDKINYLRDIQSLMSEMRVLYPDIFPKDFLSLIFNL